MAIIHSASPLIDRWIDVPHSSGDDIDASEVPGENTNVRSMFFAVVSELIVSPDKGIGEDLDQEVRCDVVMPPFP